MSVDPGVAGEGTKEGEAIIARENAVVSERVHGGEV